MVEVELANEVVLVAVEVAVVEGKEARARNLLFVRIGTDAVRDIWIIFNVGEIFRRFLEAERGKPFLSVLVWLLEGATVQECTGVLGATGEEASEEEVEEEEEMEEDDNVPILTLG